MVSDDKLSELDTLSQYLDEFIRILPTETDAGRDMGKEELFEQITGGLASLIHFLGHGIPVGKMRD